MHKRTKARINTLIMFVLLITLTVLIAWLSHRYSAEWDWTSTGRNTLSTSSKEILTKIEQPIKIVSYSTKDTHLRDIIKKFINRYSHNKNNIKLDFKNPYSINPEEIQKLDIRSNGEIIIEYNNKTEKLNLIYELDSGFFLRPDAEQIFTNALLKLAREKVHWLTFIEGHGERKALGQANFDLGLLGSQLSQRGFRIQPLNLITTGQIADNTSVLVIAGPKVDYLPGEIELLRQAINNGQNILWLTDPGKQFGLEAIAEILDIEIANGNIIDISGQFLDSNDVSIVLASQKSYLPHATTDSFNLPTVFPGSAEILIKDSDTWTHTTVIETGAHTWNEKDEISGELSYDENKDKIGPLALAVAIERTIDTNLKVNKKQRILVVGDGDFLSNTYLENGGNFELGMRIFNWLTNDDKFITIPPKTIEDTQLSFSEIKTGIILIFLWLILPGLLITIGITISIRRRRA